MIWGWRIVFSGYLGAAISSNEVGGLFFWRGGVEVFGRGDV